MKNNYIEIDNLKADVHICLFRPYGGINVKLRLFHILLKTPCRVFNDVSTPTCPFTPLSHIYLYAYLSVAEVVNIFSFAIFWGEITF